MKYTRRNRKKQLQPNRRRTKTQLNRKKYDKKIGGKKDYYLEKEVGVEPSAFFKLIQHYYPRLSISEIKNSLLNNNLNLFNLTVKTKKEMDPNYYGNETEELFSNILSGAYDDINRFDSKNYTNTFEYKSSNPSTP